MRYFKDGKPKYTIEYNEAVELVERYYRNNSKKFFLKEKDIMELTKGIIFDGDTIGYRPQAPDRTLTYPFMDGNMLEISTPIGRMNIFEGYPSSYRFTICKETSKGKYQITIDCTKSLGHSLDMDITTEKNEKDKYRIRFCPTRYSQSDSSCYSISSDDEIKIEDVFKLCNVLFHVDVTKIYESIHSSDKHEFPKFAKQLIIDAENKEKKIETTHNSSSNTSLEVPDDKIEEIFNILVGLESKGIQLSYEQEDFVKMYNKMKQFEETKSNKIKEYHERQPEIVEKQRLLREKIASENERKYAWWSNPENPSNQHKNELDKKIAQAESEIKELEELQNVGFRLTSYQEHLLEGNKLFIQNATSKDRDVIQNMDQQVIKWYREEYTDTRTRR